MAEVLFSRGTVKTLQRLPSNTVTLLRPKIMQLAAEPESLGNNIKALKGRRDHYRLRVGDWRIVFRREGETIMVLEIGPRGSIYG